MRQIRCALFKKVCPHKIDHIINQSKTLDIYDENILRAYGVGFEIEVQSSNFCEILESHGHVISQCINKN